MGLTLFEPPRGRTSGPGRARTWLHPEPLLEFYRATFPPMLAQEANDLSAPRRRLLRPGGLGRALEARQSRLDLAAA